MENDEKLLEDSLLVIWNERDREKRALAMKAVYAPEIVFYESNEGPAILGHDAINDLIAKLQEQWPTEFRFQLSGPSRVNHQIQHISWILGIPGQSPVASGMDVAIVENHLITSLHLLLDVTQS